MALNRGVQITFRRSLLNRNVTAFIANLLGVVK